MGRMAEQSRIQFHGAILEYEPGRMGPRSLGGLRRKHADRRPRLRRWLQQEYAACSIRGDDLTILEVQLTFSGT